MTRFLPLLLAVPLSTAFADTIKLKTGETLQGRVVSSDAKSVTFEIQYSPTIVDEQTYDRADIDKLTVTAGDEVAYAKIKNVKAPSTILDAKPIQLLLDKDLNPFLKQFPNSVRAGDVKKLVDDLQGDLAKLKDGSVKVSGVWFDKSALSDEKYQIDAARLAESMKQQTATNNLSGAMNAIELLQRSYPASLAFVEAVPASRKTIELFLLQVNNALINLPQTKAQRQASIDRSPIEEQSRIRAAIQTEDNQAAAIAAAAQKSNQKYYAIFPYDEKGLTAMRMAAIEMDKQFAAIDLKKLELGAQLVRRANAELAANQPDAAETTLAQLKTAWSGYEGATRLDLRLRQAKQANADALAKAATPIPSPTASPTASFK